MDDKTNLLHRVQQGKSKKGIAFEESGGSWTEYVALEQKWVTVQITFKLANAPPVPVFQEDKKETVVSLVTENEAPLRPAAGNTGSVEMAAPLKSLIAFRDNNKRGADGRAPIKVLPKRPARYDGDPESRLSSILERFVDAEEVFLLKNEDTGKIQVVVKFQNNKSAEAIRGLGKVVYPGRAAESIRPVEFSHYKDLRERCSDIVHCRTASSGAAVTSASAIASAAPITSGSSSAAPPHVAPVAPAARPKSEARTPLVPSGTSKATAEVKAVGGSSAPAVRQRTSSGSSSSEESGDDAQKRDRKERKRSKKEKKKDKKDQQDKDTETNLLLEGLKANIKKEWNKDDPDANRAKRSFKKDAKEVAAPTKVRAPAEGRRSWASEKFERTEN